MQRKIESALEDWFRRDGWSVAEHVAERAEWEPDTGTELSVSIDLSQFARDLAAELQPC